MAKNNTYSTLSNLSDVLAKELKNYSVSVTNSVKNTVEEVTKDLVKNTKADAKVGRRGKYKKSISSRTLSKGTYSLVKVWYVKNPEHRLAHLLNNGHKTKDGKFVPGDKHITRNEEKAINELERRIKEVIENGI